MSMRMLSERDNHNYTISRICSTGPGIEHGPILDFGTDWELLVNLRCFRTTSATIMMSVHVATGIDMLFVVLVPALWLFACGTRSRYRLASHGAPLNVCRVPCDVGTIQESPQRAMQQYGTAKRVTRCGGSS
ncbi:hypothetical protein GGX14DRAFT_397616 [Mycena pura]|uniref:Uncharacterized protein n=1 Tax=Mycena pura TaxID=153505 RepID=A0AAD6VBY7_9AGAR|nr:hypothetical protein GGX14DRAFT_397616 [Mycena pura]